MIKTECIILAAGYSSRAETNKMLLKIGSKNVIERCIDSFYESCSQIFVVGGYRIEELKPVLMKYKNLQLVHNTHYSDGMFSSVQEGLKYIKGDQFFITPGDYPLIQKGTIEKMLERDEPVIIPQYNGKTGHPVRINSYLIPEIVNGGYQSLREYVTTKNALLLDVDDIGVITDIDYMDDYYRILNMISNLIMEAE